MKLSVGTNFDDELLHRIKDSDVKLVYGKLSDDIFGGGRPTMALPTISKEDLERHINLAHKYGIEFNYLMNTNCMDNLEFETDFNRRLFETIKWLDKIGVDWITVSIPYLIEVIKKIAPRIKVSVSTFAYVDTLQKALEFQKLGADEITLPEGLNRNFELLKILKKNVDCKIQLIATNLCMNACPFRFYHANAQSHASQKGHISKGVTFDYCMLKCTEKTLRDPVEAIKMPWIRPEDIWAYEEIGIDSLKITERMKKTDVLADIVHAYTSRRYDGMLNRLLNFRVKEDYIQPKHDVIFENDKINKKYFLKSRELLFKRKIEIDNNKLDGFIEYFRKKKGDCRNLNCGIECRHCYIYAEKSIKLDEVATKDAAEDIAEILEKVCSGGLFDDNGKIEMIWTENECRFLEKLLEKKPEFVKNSARELIIMESEKFALAEKREKVLVKDIAKANLITVPNEYREAYLKEIENLGIIIGDD